MRSKQILLCLLITITHGVYAEQATTGLAIKQCTVFSEHDKNIRYDCTERARQLCPGGEACELPIGLNLTDNRDLDNNKNTWELVKVEYSCGGKNKVNGPHYQNDHAAMPLVCRH